MSYSPSSSINFLLFSGLCLSLSIVFYLNYFFSFSCYFCSSFSFFLLFFNSSALFLLFCSSSKAYSCASFSLQSFLNLLTCSLSKSSTASFPGWNCFSTPPNTMNFYSNPAAQRLLRPPGTFPKMVREAHVSESRFNPWMSFKKHSLA